MKEVHEEFRYDQSPAEVFGLISLGSFQVELTEHLGGKNVTLVEDTPSDMGTRVSVRQQTAVDLPGFAKKLVPASATVTQTYEWSNPDSGGTSKGTWSAVTSGAPIKIGGTTELIVTSGGGTLHRFGGEIKANVPLVGGKLEQFAMDNLRRDLAKAHEYTKSRLSSSE